MSGTEHPQNPGLEILLMGGTLYAGMSAFPGLKSGTLWSGIIGTHSPDLLVHFAPELVVQYGPDYTEIKSASGELNW